MLNFTPFTDMSAISNTHNCTVFNGLVVGVLSEVLPSVYLRVKV
jgi:hypothetical protein